MIDLRSASDADVEQVARIWHVGWHEAHDGKVPDALVAARPQESFALRSAPRVANTVGAVVDGVVAGFVMVNETKLTRCTSDAHHGTGIAAAVLAAWEQRIIEQGHPAAWLAVVPQKPSGATVL